MVHLTMNSADKLKSSTGEMQEYVEHDVILHESQKGCHMRASDPADQCCGMPHRVKIITATTNTLLHGTNSKWLKLNGQWKVKEHVQGHDRSQVGLNFAK